MSLCHLSLKPENLAICIYPNMREYERELGLKHYLNGSEKLRKM